MPKLTEDDRTAVPTWAKTLTTFGAIFVAVGVLLSQANANEKRSLKNEHCIDTLRVRELPEIKEALASMRVMQRMQNEKLDRILSRLQK